MQTSTIHQQDQSQQQSNDNNNNITDTTNNPSTVLYTDLANNFAAVISNQQRNPTGSILTSNSNNLALPTTKDPDRRSPSPFHKNHNNINGIQISEVVPTRAEEISLDDEAFNNQQSKNDEKQQQHVDNVDDDDEEEEVTFHNQQHYYDAPNNNNNNTNHNDNVAANAMTSKTGSAGSIGSMLEYEQQMFNEILIAEIQQREEEQRKQSERFVKRIRRQVGLSRSTSLTTSERGGGGDIGSGKNRSSRVRRDSSSCASEKGSKSHKSRTPFSGASSNQGAAAAANVGAKNTTLTATATNTSSSDRTANTNASRNSDNNNNNNKNNKIPSKIQRIGEQQQQQQQQQQQHSTLQSTLSTNNNSNDNQRSKNNNYNNRQSNSHSNDETNDEEDEDEDDDDDDDNKNDTTAAGRRNQNNDSNKKRRSTIRDLMFDGGASDDEEEEEEEDDDDLDEYPDDLTLLMVVSQQQQLGLGNKLTKKDKNKSKSKPGSQSHNISQQQQQQTQSGAEDHHHHHHKLDPTNNKNNNNNNVLTSSSTGHKQKTATTTSTMPSSAMNHQPLFLSSDATTSTNNNRLFQSSPISATERTRPRTSTNFLSANIGNESDENTSQSRLLLMVPSPHQYLQGSSFGNSGASNNLTNSSPVDLVGSQKQQNTMIVMQQEKEEEEEEEGDQQQHRARRAASPTTSLKSGTAGSAYGTNQASPGSRRSINGSPSSAAALRSTTVVKSPLLQTEYVVNNVLTKLELIKNFHSPVSSDRQQDGSNSPDVPLAPVTPPPKFYNKNQNNNQTGSQSSAASNNNIGVLNAVTPQQPTMITTSMPQRSPWLLGVTTSTTTPTFRVIQHQNKNASSSVSVHQSQNNNITNNNNNSNLNAILFQTTATTTSTTGSQSAGVLLSKDQHQTEAKGASVISPGTPVNEGASAPKQQENNKNNDDNINNNPPVRRKSSPTFLLQTQNETTTNDLPNIIISKNEVSNSAPTQRTAEAFFSPTIANNNNNNNTSNNKNKNLNFVDPNDVQLNAKTPSAVISETAVLVTPQLAVRVGKAEDEKRFFKNLPSRSIFDRTGLSGEKNLSNIAFAVAATSLPNAAHFSVIGGHQQNAPTSLGSSLAAAATTTTVLPLSKPKPTIIVDGPTTTGGGRGGGALLPSLSSVGNSLNASLSQGSPTTMKQQKQDDHHPSNKKNNNAETSVPQSSLSGGAFTSLHQQEKQRKPSSTATSLQIEQRQKQKQLLLNAYKNKNQLPIPLPQHYIVAPQRHCYKKLRNLGAGSYASAWLVEWLPPKPDLRHVFERYGNFLIQQEQQKQQQPQITEAALKKQKENLEKIESYIYSLHDSLHTPPAPVSGLACTRPVIRVGSNANNVREVPRERIFVCKSESIEKTEKRKSEVEGGNDQAELNVLRNVAHPNIVAFVDEMKTETENHILMEFVDGGDLRSEIRHRALMQEGGRHFSDQTILFIFVQICLAVEYLHRHNILHRDLKSANVLLSKKLFVKIADFGFAFESDKDVDQGAVADRVLGTPYYMCPTIWSGKSYNEKSDVWALGILLYEMAALAVPFYGITAREVAEKILSGAPHPPIPPRYSSGQFVSAEITELIDWCLRRDPDKRPSAGELLRHPTMVQATKNYITRFAECAAETQLDVDQVWTEVLVEHANLIARDGAPLAAAINNTFTLVDYRNNNHGNNNPFSNNCNTNLLNDLGSNINNSSGNTNATSAGSRGLNDDQQQQHNASSNADDILPRGLRYNNNNNSESGSTNRLGVSPQRLGRSNNNNNASGAVALHPANYHKGQQGKIYVYHQKQHARTGSNASVNSQQQQQQSGSMMMQQHLSGGISMTPTSSPKSRRQTSLERALIQKARVQYATNPSLQEKTMQHRRKHKRRNNDDDDDDDEYEGNDSQYTTTSDVEGGGGASESGRSSRASSRRSQQKSRHLPRK